MLPIGSIVFWSCYPLCSISVEQFALRTWFLPIWNIQWSYYFCCLAHSRITSFHKGFGHQKQIGTTFKILSVCILCRRASLDIFAQMQQQRIQVCKGFIWMSKYSARNQPSSDVVLRDHRKRRKICSYSWWRRVEIQFCFCYKPSDEGCDKWIYFLHTL